MVPLRFFLYFSLLLIKQHNKNAKKVNATQKSKPPGLATCILRSYFHRRCPFDWSEPGMRRCSRPVRSHFLGNTLWSKLHLHYGRDAFARWFWRARSQNDTPSFWIRNEPLSGEARLVTCVISSQGFQRAWKRIPSRNQKEVTGMLCANCGPRKPCWFE